MTMVIAIFIIHVVPGTLKCSHNTDFEKYQVTVCCEAKQKFYILFTPATMILSYQPLQESIPLNNDSIVKCAARILLPLKLTGKGQGVRGGLVRVITVENAEISKRNAAAAQCG